uniref:Hypothetical conserved protein n=1 Tax=uncultured prokaryote TaxID=198431 RepID=H5SPX0_9ZZZZ|nr:hypothetical conserved protein [uncultured prokaryote]
MKGTRAGQMAFGLVVIVTGFMLSQFLNLVVLQWLINNFLSSIVLILIIIFQNDIRRMLTQVGKSPFYSSLPYLRGEKIIEEIVKASSTLAKRKIGALIAIERGVTLNDFVEAGIKIDAGVTKEILISIFLPYSPLHDGAVIIQKGRITAAGCLLPLSSNPDLAPLLGTRHRAAVGLSEETDAVVVVVSEERGEISIAVDGEIRQGISEAKLMEYLHELLVRPG